MGRADQTVEVWVGGEPAAAGNPLPVTNPAGVGGLTDAELRATPVKVDDDATQAAIAALLTTAGTATSTADNTVTNASEAILAANANRKGAVIQVVSGGNARVRLDGGTAAPGNGTQLTAGGPALVLSMPFCPQGAITAIREGGSDAVIHVTEIV